MGAVVPIIAILFYLAIIAVAIASWWKIFEKAGQPGWAAIVPFYNTYIIVVEVCKLPPVWFWLTLVPCANFVALIFLAIMIPLKLAEKFGKEVGFAIGLMFLGIIFLPILAFGDAQYVGGGRKRYADDFDDEDDDYDQPRKRKRNDDEDDDDRPRKKKRDYDD